MGVGFEDVAVGSLALVRCVEWAQQAPSKDASGEVLRVLSKVGELVERGPPMAAVTALGPVCRVLRNPISGHRSRGVVEKAAKVAAAAIRASGPVVEKALGPDGVVELLGGLALQMVETDSSSIVDACLAFFENAGAWAGVWRRLNRENDPFGRALVAVVAKGAAELASRDDSNSERKACLDLLSAAVRATPEGMRADLWRCFLPGLFGHAYRIAAAPWAPRDGSIRGNALDAARELLVAVLGTTTTTTTRFRSTEKGVRVDATKEWHEDTRNRLRAYLPPMLVAARRDPSAAVRMAAVSAAKDLASTGFWEPEEDLFMVDTLLALRFDDESPSVARAATLALAECVVDTASVARAEERARRATAAARRGDERGLVDALNSLRFRTQALDEILEALVAITEVSSSAKLAALEGPLEPPSFFGTSDEAAKRRRDASRLGAAFHRPTFEWLRQPRTRDAARRACWLLAVDLDPPLVVERLLELLPRSARVLQEVLEAAACRAFLLLEGECREAVEETSAAAEFVALAELVADDVLASSFRDDDGEEPSSSLLLTDGSAAASASCRVLSRTCELAFEGGGHRAMQPVLRRVLYPLLEKLASRDAETRQGALGGLVSIAAIEDDRGKPDALAALLSRNMDYVVEAACRRLRRARTPSRAAEAAAVVEALLRHSRCSLATPLLRDVVSNALRDIDEHCLEGAKHASAFARLMKAMLSSLPETRLDDDDDDDFKKKKKKASPPERKTESWLDRVEEDLTPQHETDPVAQALLNASKLKEKVDVRAEATERAEESVAATMHRVSKEHSRKFENDGTEDPTPEENLVFDVLRRATYFVAPTMDLSTRRVALQVIADGVSRIRSNVDQVRPLVHRCWPAVRARLPTPRTEPEDLDDPELSLSLAAALDVVAAFVDAVGDFMSFKFKDDLWPGIRFVLTSGNPHPDDTKRHRRRVVDAALACLFKFSQRPDCAGLVRPVAAEAAKAALARLSLDRDDDQAYIPPILGPLLRSLALHDADAIWLLLATRLRLDHDDPPLPRLPRWPTAGESRYRAPPGGKNKDDDATHSFLLEIYDFLRSTSSTYDRVVLW